MFHSSDPIPPLTAHLGYWLRAASNTVSQGFARLLADEDVTTAEWVVLRALHEEALSPSRLADVLGLTRGAISKLAERLVAKGMIERNGVAGDARAQRLSLTDEGRALLPRLAALADRNDASFFEELDPDTRAQLEAVLRSIAARGGSRTPME